MILCLGNLKNLKKKKKKKTWGYLSMDLSAKLTNYFNKWFIHATCEIHVTKFWLIGLVDDHECEWLHYKIETKKNKNKTLGLPIYGFWV